MVQASDLLLMTDLKSLCCQFLESCITAENCIGIRLFSLHYCLYHVNYTATEFLQTHFSDVSRTEEFRELPPDRLCEILSMEKLNIGNEKHILEAVVKWFGHDPEDRRVGTAPTGPCGHTNKCVYIDVYPALSINVHCLNKQMERKELVK